MAVGGVRAELAAAGIADRTLVIFTSDNGGFGRHVTSNAPLRGEKGQQWEGGERVPAIVYWPGVTRPGSVCTEHTITMDYYPTIMAITGAAGRAEHNGRLDGLSLLPLLRNPDERLERDMLFWHYPTIIPSLSRPIARRGPAITSSSSTMRTTTSSCIACMMILVSRTIWRSRKSRSPNACGRNCTRFANEPARRCPYRIRTTTPTTRSRRNSTRSTVTPPCHRVESRIARWFTMPKGRNSV